MATAPLKPTISDPGLRERLYELLEQDHLPYSVGSRFVRLGLHLPQPRDDGVVLDYRRISK